MSVFEMLEILLRLTKYDNFWNSSNTTEERQSLLMMYCFSG